MNKTWMPEVAGFMGIIVGGLQIPFTISMLFGSVIEQGFSIDGIILFTLMALFGCLAIIGGVSHLQRTKWPLAMVGSIAVFFCFAQFSLPQFLSWSWYEIHPIQVVLMVIGIVPIVLTLLSKKEFK